MEKKNSSIKHSENTDSLCYFLVCFREKEFVAFLIASLFRDQDTFIIHCDKKAPRLLRSYVRQLKNAFANVIVIESRDYSWAGFSHVDLSLKAIEVALGSSENWSHLIFLSEQHLPLKSPPEIACHLRDRKSIVAIRPVTSMGGGERADIESRFGGNYRELPGVGCFVTGTAARDPFQNGVVYHGSNWMVLCRDHCAILDQANHDGKFVPYESVVHPEETAIPSILSPYLSEIEYRDAVIVANPDITDNGNLVMSEDLYKKSIDTDYLFIRKRTVVLSDFVKTFVKENHFDRRIYEIDDVPDSDAAVVDIDVQHVFSEISTAIQGNFGSDVQLKLIERNIYGAIPRFYAVINHASLSEEISVRVLSENLLDYKVLILKSESFNGFFEKPYEDRDYVYSTIRSRTHELFGSQEILPKSFAHGGFVSIDDPRSVADVAAAASEFLGEAIAFSKLPKARSKSDSVSRKMTDDTRAVRLNNLATICDAKRYLEVGVCKGDTFFDVNVSYKVAVDPNFLFDYRSKTNDSTIFHPVVSDAFFQTSSEEPFDLIYLDGLHTYEQTTRDFINSLRFAHDKTIWLIDDTVPNDVFSAIPDQQRCYNLRHSLTQGDWSWMGDVYKTVFFIERMFPAFQFRTYSGHGQTVIWRSGEWRDLRDREFGLDRIGVMGFEDFVGCLDVMRIETEMEILNAIRLTYDS